MYKFKGAAFTLAVLSAGAAIAGVSLLQLRPTEASADAASMYVVPIDGYYAEDKNNDLKVNDGGMSLWLGTSEGGRGGENGVWNDLGEKWFDPGSEGFNYYNEYVLINGKTFTELNETENAGLARFVTGWYGGGLFCLRIHCDGAMKPEEGDIDTVTLKKGFQMLNTKDEKLGSGIPADITMAIEQIDGKWMAVRATESVTVKSQPVKMDYIKNDVFDKTGLTFEAVYTDGGTGTITAKDEMIVSYDFTGAEAGTVDVVCNVNGVEVKVPVNYAPVAVDLEKADQITLDGVQESYVRDTAVTGLTLKNVPMTDGTVQDVPVTETMLTAKTFMAGEFTGTIEYLNYTHEFTYTVVNPDNDNVGEYVVPIDGYYAGSDGAGKTADDAGLSLWLVTSESGLGGEAQWQGLGEKWFEQGTDEFEYLNAYVLINGKSFKELNETENAGLTRFVLGWYGTGSFCLRIHCDGDYKVNNGKITSITLKKGMHMLSNTGVKLGGALPEDITMTAVQLGGKWMFVRSTESAEVATMPDKTLYFKNDVFDFSGLTFDVTYTDKNASGNNYTATIDAKTEMITAPSFDSDENGKKDVVCNVNGVEVVFQVDYQAIVVDLDKADSVTLEGVKEKYTCGDEMEGLILKNVPMSDGSVQDVPVTAQMLSAKTFAAGTFEGTITYLNFEYKFTYTVENTNGVKLTVDSSAYSIVSDINERIGIKFDIFGTEESVKALEYIDCTTDYNMGDYVYINGVSLTELKANYKIRNLNQYGTTILIGFYESDGDAADVPAEFKDENGLVKDCLTKADIRTIEFKKGFTFVTARADHWATGDAQETAAAGGYYCVPGATLETDVLLVAYPATSTLTRWIRPLDFEGDVDGLYTSDGSRDAINAIIGEAKEGAMELTLGKTEYKVGEAFDAAGYSCLVTYKDGGQETITFNSAAVQGFNASVPGEYQCSFAVNTDRVTFTVTVTADDEDSSGGDEDLDSSSAGGNAGGTSAGCGSALGMLGVMGMAAVGAAFALRSKRRNRKD
mgnify:CR=1 FL=1